MVSLQDIGCCKCYLTVFNFYLQIALPLICNDNTNLLETYITGNKGLQVVCLSFELNIYLITIIPI